MTVSKGFKRLVRNRMVATGQTYMQARADLVRERAMREMGHKLGEAAAAAVKDLDDAYARAMGAR